MSIILGTGSYLPPKVLTNDDLAKIVDTNDEWIVTRTGIRERHIAEGESTLDLALEAAKRALASAGVTPEQLGLIVCATITADHVTPALACELHAALGASCAAFDVGAACSGFLYALFAGHRMRGDAPTLVIGCDRLTAITDWTDRGTCVLFGDGAGAVVLGSGEREQLRWFRLMAYPDTRGALSVPGTCGGPRYVHMNGQEVFKFATRAYVRDMELLLSENGITARDIAWFVPHQANARIIAFSAERLGVPLDKFYINIDRTGNTSAASVIIALDELNAQGKLHKGDLLALGAFGGGLSSGAALIEW